MFDNKSDSKNQNGNPEALGCRSGFGKETEPTVSTARFLARDIRFALSLANEHYLNSLISALGWDSGHLSLDSPLSG